MLEKLRMKYRPEIDGLRAIAVVPVMLFHAGFQTFSGGFVGVDVFFVISGYLITTILLTELHEDRFSLLNFYERRARRILPALFLVMAVSIPFAWILLVPSDRADFANSLVAVTTFSSNILFWLESDYFDTATELKPMLHTWSLAVEEQYYIIFPLFLMFTWKFGIKWIATTLSVIFVISLLAGDWGSQHAPSAAFYLLPMRAWEVLIGTFAALFSYHYGKVMINQLIANILSLIGLLLIAYAIVAFDEHTPFPSLYALTPTIGAVLIILFAHKGTIVQYILQSKGFVGIGLLSYSAYLWHQPIFSFYRHGSRLRPDTDVFWLLIPLTFFLAWLTWKYVEAPFRYKKRFNTDFIFKYSMVGLGVFALVGVSIPSYKAENKFANWGPDVRQYDCHLQGERQQEHKEFCTKDTDGILLWGDSHAASLYPGLSAHAGKNNQTISQLTQSACPPLLDLKVLKQRKSCNEINKRILKHVKDNSYETIILHAAWKHGHYPLTYKELEKKLKDTVRKIKKSSPDSRIVVIGNVPRWYISAQREFNLSRRIKAIKALWKEDEFETADTDNILYGVSDVRPGIDRKLSRIAKKQEVTYISAVQALCTKRKYSKTHRYCALSEGGGKTGLTYIDYGHLSKIGSNLLIDRIADDLFQDNLSASNQLKK